VNALVKSITPREKDLIDRIADNLPANVRTDYYREMTHCRNLPDNDELLRILRAMQFLSLLIYQAPDRLATEREQLDLNLDRCVSALTTIESRLEVLPEGLSSKIGPEQVAARINESLRQQFVATTIPQTGAALNVIATELERSVNEFVRATKEISNKYDGAASAACAAVQSIESAITSASRTSREATAELRQTLLNFCWWILTIGAIVIFLLGWISRGYFR
jgi:hypothetical protein